MNSLLLAAPWALVGLRLALAPTIVLFAVHRIQVLLMVLATLVGLAGGHRGIGNFLSSAHLGTDVRSILHARRL